MMLSDDVVDANDDAAAATIASVDIAKSLLRGITSNIFNKLSI